MDRAMLQDHLAMAERHVSEGEGHILRQRRVIADLERDGRDSAAARATLAQFEELQKIHIENRDRLLRELSE